MIIDRLSIGITANGKLLWISCKKKGPNLPPWATPWALYKSSRVVRLAFFGENSKWWTKIRTRQREEGHLTILLAQLVLNEDELFSNFGYVAKLHKDAIEKPYFCCTIYMFWHQTKKGFCFFEQLLSNFRYKKQLLIVFWATLTNILSNYWKISSNLWKALRKPFRPVKPL